MCYTGSYEYEHWQLKTITTSILSVSRTQERSGAAHRAINPGNQKKARGDGHLRRGEILAVAKKIFVSEGYEAATIRRIAEEVGVSSTALYMHFADKDAIILEICAQTIGELHKLTLKHATGDGDAISKVRAMLTDYILFGVGNPATYQLAFGMSFKTDRATQAKILVMSIDCFRHFSHVLRDLEIENCMNVNDRKSVNQTVWAACHGLVTMLISFPSFPWSSKETLIKTMLDALLFGLIDSPKPSPSQVISVEAGR